MIKKIYYGLVLFVVMGFVPLTAKAECDYTRLAELNREASNVQFSYNYKFGENVIFSVTATNITNDIYMVDDYYSKFNGHLFEETEDYEMNGVTLKYNIYSNDNNCRGELLLTKYVSLPSYNKYSTYKICTGHEKLAVCARWVDTSVYSLEDVENIISKKSSSKNNDDLLGNNSIYEVIIDTFKNNFITIGFSLAGIIVLIIIFVVKKVRKK